MPDSIRCRLHGGRPPGTPQHPNTRAAAIEGRRRWLAAQRLAKQAGLIEKIPGGRRAKGLPKLSKDRTIRKAQRVLEEMMARKALRVVGEVEGPESLVVPPAREEEPAVEAESAPEIEEGVGVSPERLEELENAESLLDDLIIELVDRDLWETVAAALPDELFKDLDSYAEPLFAEDEAGK
jgi:hypothetical protein